MNLDILGLRNDKNICTKVVFCVFCLTNYDSVLLDHDAVIIVIYYIVIIIIIIIIIIIGIGIDIDIDIN